MSGDSSDKADPLVDRVDGYGEVTIPPAKARNLVTSFISDYVQAADASGVVVNLSGGLDSTVTAALAVEALGPESVYGLILPSNLLDSSSAQDAEAIAQLLDIEYDTIHIQPLLSQLSELAPDPVDLHGNPIVRGNLTARIRMTFAYLSANAMDRLVVGTTNLSELLLGYFTKYGDGGVDFLPLGDLYKTEIRELGRELEVPDFVIEKPATAEFWPGQLDTEDIGEPYPVIDSVLHLYVSEDFQGPEIAAELDISIDSVERILYHHRTTSHKRAVPPTSGYRDVAVGVADSSK